MKRLGAAGTLVWLLLSARHAMAAPQPCESLTQLRLPDTTITTAVSISGTFTPPDAR
jgi:hypothetical protein